MTMNDSIVTKNRNRGRRRMRFRSVLGILLTAMITTNPTSRVSASASSTPPSSPTAAAATKTSTLDLSYLHRTKSTMLAQAIQDRLEHSKGDDDDDVLSQDQLDIDVTASWIGKNIQDVLQPLIRTRSSGSGIATTFAKVGLIAKRNQWSAHEATILFEALAGPEEETRKTKSAISSRKKKQKKQSDLKDANDEGETPSDIVANSTNVTSGTTTAAAQNRDPARLGNSSATTETTENEKEVTDPNVTTTALNETSNVITFVSSTSENSTTNTTMQDENPSMLPIARLDLGWNDLSRSVSLALTSPTVATGRRGPSPTKAFLKALQRTIQLPNKCPTELRLQVCGLGPAACRAIGKGLLARYHIGKENEENREENGDESLPPALSLYLTRNEAIGDAGVAALSAALRTISSTVAKRSSNNDGNNKNDDNHMIVLEVLDLSGCGITDTGAEALAIALEGSPLCVRHLDLSNNQISNNGAAALGQALAVSTSKIESLNLSNNKDIDDAGAKALAAAWEQGTIDTLRLQSCHIHADGAASLMMALRGVASRSKADPTEGNIVRHLDLSGNPLGILRKAPKAKGGGKYSATAMRSKASATTTAYMNLIGKTVQKGLKDLGMDNTSGASDTLESDDEEEAQMTHNDNDDEDPSKVKCGAMAIADALLFDSDDNSEDQGSDGTTKDAGTTVPCKVELGLRHCSFDTRASEALAAVRQEALSSFNIDLTIDVRMNNVLEDDTIAALRGDPELKSDLNEMAERYLEVMEAVHEAQRRSLAAAKVASSRMRMEEEMEDAWGAPVDMGEGDLPSGSYDDAEEDRWDSDADYDDEGDYY